MCLECDTAAVDRYPPFAQENLPPDVKLALDQHGHILRLSYLEIVSGVTRLARQGIPRAIIMQVLNHAVEAVAKKVEPSAVQTNISSLSGK